jgi:hypothetical protein
MGQRTITDLQFLKNKWPSAIVARSQVQFFTGGAVKGSTIANLDSLGEGPPEVVRIGRAVGYPVDSFISWLEQRVAAKHDNVRARKRRQG